MEKTKMLSKINPLKETPDQELKGCCCGSSAKKQDTSATKPLSGTHFSQPVSKSDRAIDIQIGGR